MSSYSKQKKILEVIGKKLKKAREGVNLSQEKLAEKTKLHRTYIGMVERGERNPTIGTLYRIVKALETTSQEILPF